MYEIFMLDILYPYLLWHFIFPYLIKVTKTPIEAWHEGSQEEGRNSYDFWTWQNNNTNMAAKFETRDEQAE